MRWDPLLRPVGPLRPAVYWRRRLVVLAVLILVVVLAARAFASGRPAVPDDRGPRAPVSTSVPLGAPASGDPRVPASARGCPPAAYVGTAPATSQEGPPQT
jgi:hypothetical protein